MKRFAFAILMAGLISTSYAEESFSIFKSVTGEAMTDDEMAAVEGKGNFGGYDWQGNYYRTLPINPYFAYPYNQYVGVLSNRIQQQGTGLYGIDGMNRIVSQVSGVPYVSAVDTFNGMFSKYGVTTNSCAACSGNLNNLLNAANSRF